MTTEPLSRGQQLILQELLAAHVVSQDEAMELFQRHNDTHCASLEECFRGVNVQLSAGFGLEVASVVLQEGTRYHSIINKHADDVAKTSFSSEMNPHQYEFVRAVFRKLVEDQKASRVDLINLKNDLKEPFKVLSLDESERMLEMLLDEKWLVSCGTKNRRDSMKQDYTIGPRTYLELSHLLTDFGLEELPQVFFHRK